MLHLSTISLYKKLIQQCGYFVARNSRYQPITWETHEIFLVKNEPFNFPFFIDRSVRYNFLINVFNFVSHKIIDIRVPKDKKLTKKDKLRLSKAAC